MKMIKNVACLNSLYSYLPTHIKFLTEFHRIFFGTTCISFPKIIDKNWCEYTALSFNMEKRRQSPLPHLWRMGHFFFVLYVSILRFSQKACFCYF